MNVQNIHIDKENLPENLEELRVSKLSTRFDKALERRSLWESLWDDCYDMALPQRNGFGTGQLVRGERQTDQIFDATAMDAVDQLAASLLGHLTPPWTQWFGLIPGPDVPEDSRDNVAKILEQSAKTIQMHFDRSNFIVELHQCFLDLVVGGTASLLFEETAPGELSAFRFSSVPLHHIALEEGETGFLDNAYRQLSLTYEAIRGRYPFADIDALELDMDEEDREKTYDICECVVKDVAGFRYTAFIKGKDKPLINLVLPQNPFINFRWMKSPGESYGRSPVMKALPDIKTVNKVVELILKNASIAISGIWQADDDGVLNPANIDLTPGSIIPKAVGSKGLTPLDMPARFDVSQLVLDDLRARIRHALLTDKLPQISGPRMTATEVLERSADMSLLLGATYGRLQSELLTPLIERAYTILRERGEIPDLRLDGRTVLIDYRSPLARSQANASVQNTLSWITSVLSMGPEAAASVNISAAAKYLGEALGVPSDIIRSQPFAELEDLAQTALNETQPNDVVDVKEAQNVDT